MIGQTINYDFYPISPVVTIGLSETANYIDSQAREMREHMQYSYYLGFGAKGIFDELRIIADECRIAGWDGYNARAISERTLEKSIQFLFTLPLETPVPDIGAEPDGSITFEWYQTPLRVLSISISSDDFIHYAFLYDNKKKYGSEPFTDSISRDIISLIKDVTK